MPARRLAAARASSSRPSRRRAIERERATDPWWAYDFGQAWRIETPCPSSAPWCRDDERYTRLGAADLPHDGRHARVTTMLCGLGCGAGALTVTLTAASAQDQPAPLFRTRADVVRVDVLATAGGRPLHGLKAEDFELYDNGVLAAVPQLASIDDLEIDVVLALDASSSVKRRAARVAAPGRGRVGGALKPGDRAADADLRQRDRRPDAAHPRPHGRSGARSSRSRRRAVPRSSTRHLPASRPARQRTADAAADLQRRRRHG